MSSTNVVTGAAQEVIKKGFFPSLMKSGTIVKTVLGLVVSFFAVAATATTVMVVVGRSSPRAPFAQPDKVFTWKNTAVNISCLVNDVAESGNLASTGDNNLLTISQVTAPLFGIAEIVKDSTMVRYIPNAQFAGSDVFQYAITNGRGTSWAQINVTVRNHEPVATADSFLVAKNVETALDVVANDEDQDNDALTVVSITALSQDLGDLQIKDNKVLFTPFPQMTGSATFTYTISDSNDTATAQVQITLNNEPPVANTDEYYVSFNTGTDLDVLANDKDPNGDSIEIILVSGAEYGFVENMGRYLRYYPRWRDAASSGNDEYSSADAFVYTITDGLQDPYTQAQTQASANVFINIVNRPPVAENITINVPKNANWTELFAYAGIYYDPDDFTTLDVNIISGGSIGEHELTCQGIESTVQYPSSLAEDGSLVFEPKSYTKTECSLLYMPYRAITGTDTIAYSVSDGSVNAAVTGYITINVINTPPTANPDSITVQRNSFHVFDPIEGEPAPQGTDVDINGDPIALVYTLEKQPAHGDVSFQGDKIRYAAHSLYVGPDSFSYSITDDSGAISSGTVSVTVVNTPPVAVADSVSVLKNDVARIHVLSNDTDANNDPLSIVPNRFTDVSSGPHGARSVVSSSASDEEFGPDYIYYVTVPNQVYTDVFTYTIYDNDPTDPNATISISTATVTVNVYNVAPVAEDDTVDVLWRRTSSIFPLENDHDANPNEALVISYYSAPAHGSLELSADGTSLKYTPTGDYTCPDSFTYKLKDGSDAESNVATVTINVVNHAPVAVGDSIEVHWATSVALIDVLTNDSDQDNDTLQIVDFTTGDNFQGTLAVRASKDGFDYYPTGGSKGTSTFTYTISDGDKTASASVAISVTNTLPVGVADAFYAHFTSWESGYTIAVLDNDSDADQDTLSVLSVSNPSKGAASVSVDGTTVFYNPDSCFLGDDVFTYTLFDGLESVADIHVTVTLGDANAPAPRPDAYTLHWRNTNGGYILQVTNNDDDLDGDKVYVKSVDSKGSPLGGSVSLSGNSSVLYVPNPQGILGTDVFQYVATDLLRDNSSMVTVTISNTNPSAQQDQDLFHWRAARLIAVLTNDSDEDGDPIALLAVSQQPTSGSATKVNSTHIQYQFSSSSSIFASAATSATYATAQDSFTYTITDGSQAGRASAQVKLEVYDNKPQAVNDLIPVGTVAKNGQATTLNVLANDVDLDAADVPYLSITNVRGVVGGTVTYNATHVRFTPNSGFVGNATFQYKISDGVRESDYATVIVPVGNAFPVCTKLNHVMYKNQGPKTFTLDASSLACSDADGDAISITSSSISSTPAKGSSSFTASSITFTPAASRSGEIKIEFRVTDGSVTVPFTITITIPNNAPASIDRQWSWSKKDPAPAMNVITPGSSDPDNDTLIVARIATTSQGAQQVSSSMITWSTVNVSVSDSNGELTVSAEPYWKGSVEFNYILTDGDLDNPKESPVSKVVLTRTSEPPVAVDDSYSLDQSVAQYTLDVLDNDYDNDSPSILISSVEAVTPNAPTVAIDSAMKYLVVSLGPGAQCGTFEFKYTIATDDGTASAYVELDIYNCNCDRGFYIMYIFETTSRMVASGDLNAACSFHNSLNAKAGIDKEGRKGAIIQFGSTAEIMTQGWTHKGDLAGKCQKTRKNPMYGLSNIMAACQKYKEFIQQYPPPVGTPIYIVMALAGKWYDGYGDPTALATELNSSNLSSPNPTKIIIVEGEDVPQSERDYIEHLAYTRELGKGVFLTDWSNGQPVHELVDSMYDSFCAAK